MALRRIRNSRRLPIAVRTQPNPIRNIETLWDSGLGKSYMQVPYPIRRPPEKIRNRTEIDTPMAFELIKLNYLNGIYIDEMRAARQRDR